MSIIRRISTLHKHVRRYSAVTLREDLLLPEGVRRSRDETWNILEDLHPERTRGFRVELEVNHDQKKIDLLTEHLSNYEKLTIYMKHRNIVRKMYPEYIIFERHI